MFLFLKVIVDFVVIFVGFFIIGCGMLFVNVLVMKFIKIGSFFILEMVLFFLMLYCIFLVVEFFNWFGIVVVFFCGIM